MKGRQKIMSKVNTVFIIPLHKDDEMVFDALGSIPNNEKYQAIVCCPQVVADWFNKKAKGVDRCEVLVVDGNSTYPNLVNAGIEESKKHDPEFISILEYDDTLTPNCDKILSRYLDDDEVGIFAPLSCVVKDGEDGDKPTLIGIANEATFAPNIAEQEGYFDFNMMLKTNFLFVNGTFIRPSVIEEYGPFKTNFEMFYDYEWALRMVYCGAIIKSIPKVTHLHRMNLSGAFEEAKKAPKEVREKWLGASRREYFFIEDRELDI